jgi:RNA polymerase sigma-70 factor (ECF subfamily)
MGPDPAFTELMQRLRGGAAAAAEVFDRFTRRLIGLARSQLDSRLLPRADPEDIVQSVYRSFFTRHDAGRFNLADWDSLWANLAVITVRKCANRAKYLQRDCRDVSREASLEALAQRGDWEALSREPTPEEALLLTETIDRLMRGLDEGERDMLGLALQGYTPQEISPRVGCSKRTAQRLLKRVQSDLWRWHAEDLPQ